MGRTVSFSCDVILEDCCVCGGPIALMSSQRSVLRENHGTFYCPLGHQNYWPGETEAETYRKKLAESERLRVASVARLDQEKARAAAAEQATRDADARTDKLKKRSRAGVCPCCHRTFKQVAAHMKNKHPEVTP